MQISKLNTENLSSFFSQESALQSVRFNFQNKSFECQFLREDLLHPVVSGNKFRKLSGWLNHYYNNGYSQISSMGGAYSNHLAALAFACKALHIPLSVYCREHDITSPFINLLRTEDTKCITASRSVYRTLRVKAPILNSEKLWIPEGASGSLSEEGFSILASFLPPTKSFHFLICAGTGSTAMALAKLGFPCTALLAVKDASVSEKLSQKGIEVLPSYRLAPFGKIDAESINLSKALFEQCGILLDPVYQAKGLLYAIQNSVLKPQHVIYHSGGLIGWLGYPDILEQIVGTAEKTRLMTTFEHIFSKT